jgi:hypothetical protein
VLEPTKGNLAAKCRLIFSDRSEVFHTLATSRAVTCAWAGLEPVRNQREGLVMLRSSGEPDGDFAPVSTQHSAASTISLEEAEAACDACWCTAYQRQGKNRENRRLGHDFPCGRKRSRGKARRSRRPGRRDRNGGRQRGGYCVRRWDHFQPLRPHSHGRRRVPVRPERQVELGPRQDGPRGVRLYRPAKSRGPASSISRRRSAWYGYAAARPAAGSES